MTDTDPDPQPTEDPKPQDPPKDPSASLGDPGKKALAEERQRAKAAEKRAAELEARLKEIDDAGKSEAEKTSERLAAAEKAATEAEQRALRLEIAAEKGLTPKQAKRLVGSTRDELESDADELLATFGGASKQPTGPKPDPTQGSKGTPTPKRPTSLGAALTAHMTARRT